MPPNAGRVAVCQPRNRQTIPSGGNSKEAHQASSESSGDHNHGGLEDLPAQLPVVVGPDRSTNWGTTRVDAPCQHSNHNECLRQGNDRRQTAGTRERGRDDFEASREPHEQARSRGRETGTCGYRGLKWSWELRLEARNLLKKLVAGAGFEPATFGL